LEFAGDEDDVIVNPTLLAEVLSDSTEAYDRGKKFAHYRQIPTLKEYLLVSQSEPHIEQFLRADSREWRLREVAGLEARLELPSLKITIALSEIFANVKFGPSSLRVTGKKARNETGRAPRLLPN
jgi:Uma2 family endonuclease